MENFTLSEVAFASVTVSAAISSIVLAMSKSRCTDLSFCWGLAKCNRDPPPLPIPAVKKTDDESETFHSLNSVDIETGVNPPPSPPRNY